MHRSSESIAKLARALAKAQPELTNPEKSLVGTIRADSGVEQSFRYAPLSSGLDIVRRILGQHEIATVQTTAIDRQAGIINLTTLLAHSSGEWIASDWPVCTVTETASPHRMGAALTYARRYALFTLVGIAGEDDLDAPDLTAPTNQTSGSEKPGSEKSHGLNGGQTNLVYPAVPRNRRNSSNSGKVRLTPEASAELRDRLLAELAGLSSEEDAAIWAHQSLPAKNGLTALDAQRVEEVFAARLAGFAKPPEDAAPAVQRPEHASAAQHRQRSASERRRRPNEINKSALSIPEPRRVRDRNHVRSVAKQPCLVCDRRPADAHHLRFAQLRALGRKVSDEFTVPLCRGHHREVHRCGDEAAWWRSIGIDPTIAARALWLETHPLPVNQPDVHSDTPVSTEVHATDFVAPLNQSVGPWDQHQNEKPDEGTDWHAVP